MKKEVIFSKDAPKAIGPYSQAIKAGDFIFCSGQIPIDPSTGKMISGDISVQTHRVLTNLKMILKEAGCSFDDVVKTTIYLKSLDDFQTVNSVYAEYLKEQPPARATIQVGKLPLDAGVEIECIAFKK